MRKLIFHLLSIGTIIALWQISAAVIATPLILPSCSAVVTRLFTLATTDSFWQNVLATLTRVFFAFALSVVLGATLGFFSGIFPSVRAFFAFPLSLIRTVPVVSLILIAVFVFQSTAVPIFAAVLMALPVMTNAVSASFDFSESDKKNLDMARVFGFTKRQIFRFVLVPKMKTNVASGLISVFGMTWKVVAAGEVLSLPKKALGSLLQTAQVHLETTDVYAYSLAIVILSFVLESLAKLLVKKGLAS